MKLPNSIPHSIECPFCENSFSKLEYQKNTLGYDYLVYYCDFCKSGWTTTESDTISLNLYNSLKRKKNRKDKIDKLI